MFPSTEIIKVNVIKITRMEFVVNNKAHKLPLLPYIGSLEPLALVPSFAYRVMHIIQ